jgi:hypothetical protein
MCLAGQYWLVLQPRQRLQSVFVAMLCRLCIRHAWEPVPLTMDAYPQLAATLATTGLTRTEFGQKAVCCGHGHSLAMHCRECGGWSVFVATPSLFSTCLTASHHSCIYTRSTRRPSRARASYSARKPGETRTGQYIVPPPPPPAPPAQVVRQRALKGSGRRQCPACPKKFVQKPSLNKHFQKVHHEQ